MIDERCSLRGAYSDDQHIYSGGILKIIHQTSLIFRWSNGPIQLETNIKLNEKNNDSINPKPTILSFQTLKSYLCRKPAFLLSF